MKLKDLVAEQELLKSKLAESSDDEDNEITEPDWENSFECTSTFTHDEPLIISGEEWDFETKQCKDCREEEERIMEEDED